MRATLVPREDARGRDRAAGPPDALEELEIALLLEAVHQRQGYDFRGYALSALRRRIRRRVSEEGAGTVAGLLAHVLHDKAAMQRLVQGLSVTTTSMFRDPGFFRRLRETVLPLLRTYPAIRIWHAGCSSGEEVYSLAILLAEEGLYGRSRIYATDVHPWLLHRAAAGTLELEAVRRWTEAYEAAGGKARLSDYYTRQGQWAVLDPGLRRNVMFAQHNLATDASFNEFNLILCRNVMMYFGAPLQHRAQALLDASLVRFGFLGLGRRETLEPGGRAGAGGYSLLDAREKLYRKVA
jgi:chemotaxis protein methyltransferase CheR